MPTRLKNTSRDLTLASFETWIGLVDDIDPALAADQLVVAMTLHQALERIANFHVTPICRNGKKLNSLLYIETTSHPVNHC